MKINYMNQMYTPFIYLQINDTSVPIYRFVIFVGKPLILFAAKQSIGSLVRSFAIEIYIVLTDKSTDLYIGAQVSVYLFENKMWLLCSYYYSFQNTNKVSHCNHPNV